MAINLLGIGGEPATGKTALMVWAMNELNLHDTAREISLGVCRGLYWAKAKVMVLGVYDGSLFQGTDRLSMAAQPDAVRLIQSLESSHEAYDGHTVIFEGDRLFTQSFLVSCKDLLVDRAQFWLLTVSAEAKAARHLHRKDSQREQWLRSRATKYANLLKAHSHIEQRPNETPADQQQLAQEILRFAKVPSHQAAG
jgi:hypothetical protein